MREENQMVTDEEIMIEVFKTSTPVRRHISKGEKYRNKREEFQPYMILGTFAIGFLLAVLAGMFLLKFPVVMVCVILVLEVMIAACLHGAPVWLHGLEMISGITAGMIFGKAVFMVIAAMIYLAAVLTLYLLDRRESE